MFLFVLKNLAHRGLTVVAVWHNYIDLSDFHFIFNPWIKLIQVDIKTGPGPWFNIKMSSYQYRKSHCGDKTVVRSYYLHNGISYTGKMTSLYWFGSQVPAIKFELAELRKEIIDVTNLVIGLVQDCSISIANTLEILPSCTKPSMYPFVSRLCWWAGTLRLVPPSIPTHHQPTSGSAWCCKTVLGRLLICKYRLIVAYWGLNEMQAFGKCHFEIHFLQFKCFNIK